MRSFLWCVRDVSGVRCRTMFQTTTVCALSYATWGQQGVWELINTYLRELVRETKENREPEPSAAIIDRQSVKTPDMRGERGYDVSQKITGRKRTIVGDMLGLLLLVVVHSAAIQDRDGACTVFDRLSERFPCIRLVCTDGGYAGGLEAIVTS